MHWILTTLLVVSFNFLLAQPPKKEQKYKQNKLQIRNQSQKQKQQFKQAPPKATLQQSMVESLDTLKKEAVPFNPIREPKPPAEPRFDDDTAEVSVVRVSEYLQIDCVWVKSAEYYKTWSSVYINPYRRDASTLKDTIHLTLYDEVKGQYWSKPLDELLLTSPFGYRWGRMHQGIDLNLRIGTPIYSIFDGIVRIATAGYGYGYHVVVRHINGLETLYAHMSKLSVKVGQVVKAGELLGLGGSTGWSTGPHLHLEVLYAGNAFNPLLIFEVNPKSDVPFVRSKYFALTPAHFRHINTVVKREYFHVVRAGETLQSIAQKYGLGVNYLAVVNRISVNTKLRPGQRIRLR